MDKIRRQIDVLLFDGINVLDVAGPAQAFSTAYIDGDKAYGLRYISINGQAVRASCGLSLVADASITTTPSQTDSRSVPYDLLIPGGVGIDIALEDPTLTTLIGDWHLHHPGGRLAAVCSGGITTGKFWHSRRQTRHHPLVTSKADHAPVSRRSMEFGQNLYFTRRAVHLCRCDDRDRHGAETDPARLW